MNPKRAIPLAVGLVALMLGAFALSLWHAPFLRVDGVQLVGNSRTTSGAIMASLELGEEQALVSVDTDRAERAIEQLPWVEEVKVSRKWPSTVRVTIRERSAAFGAAAFGGTDWLVLARDGHVLERRLTPPSDLPLIRIPQAGFDLGSVGAPLPGMERPLRIAMDLPAQLKPWIEGWTLSKDGDVVASLVGTAIADFGAQSDHRTQFVSLASILEGDVPLACISEIDLSIEDTPVINRDPQCLEESRALQ